jgi:tyrosyl-tRNA synthetase
MFGFTKKPAVSTDLAKIDSLLSRGVEDVFVKESLKAKLLSGKRLRIKLGIDPTSRNIHLGRAVTLRKLREFQRLGHQVVFLIGDFTAQIGDASDKLSKRPMLSSDAVKENMKTYIDQVGKILDISQIEVVYNSKWLSKLGFAEICNLADSFSVQQMSARRNFADRFEKGEEVSLREFMYPLMQGYDSVPIRADVEIGGFDQLFNLKAGRIIQRYYGQPEQDVLTTQMLEGTDGRKMSSSWGNIIAINDAPKEMFGKILSLKDELIGKYFLLCTEVGESEITEMERQTQEGSVNPKDLKIKLAKLIVTEYHSASDADKAEKDFQTTFAEKGVPEDAPKTTVATGELLVDVLVREKIVDSKSEFRRLLTEGAIKDAESGEVIQKPDFSLGKNQVFKVGKRRFLKVEVK